jgi:hypothetical protein
LTRIFGDMAPGADGDFPAFGSPLVGAV